MAIFKANVKDRYTQIPNETLQDTSLSFEARGLLTLILSLPENWEIHKTWLVKQSVNCGKDKLTRILMELQNAGYMEKKPRRGEGGRVAGWDWFVYPVPVSNGGASIEKTAPAENKPESGSTAEGQIRPTVPPVNGEQATTKKHINKQTKSTTTQPGSAPFDFSKFLEESTDAALSLNPEITFDFAIMKAEELFERYGHRASAATCSLIIVNDWAQWSDKRKEANQC